MCFLLLSYIKNTPLIRMNKWGGFLKSGNYLSSQQYLASTFGVKELNFCVRNENRWDLFAIITAMVIYSALAVYIRFYTSFLKRLTTRQCLDQSFLSRLYAWIV